MIRATKEEAFDASLDYFGGDEIAAEKFVEKYALQDRDGYYEELTPRDMHHRLAREFARIEASFDNSMSEDEIFGLFDRFKYVIPQGSPMSGIGNPHRVQSISNCFVVPSPYDSYGGIMHADQQLVQIMKRRGGVGIDVSTIRPRGLDTENAAKTTDGIGVFMQRYSNSCREVAQGGRRGALMLTIDCHHPQIRDFINIKKDLEKVTGANISIRLSDEFMGAVEHGGPVQLRFPVEPDVEHLVEEWVNAADLWNEIVQAAHDCAEPGLMFWDNIINRSPADIYAKFGFKTISTNPCITGDTLIAVADGRNAVSIKQLVDEGRDVPVYSTDPNTGRVEIKMGRNPHLTGEKREVWRLLLDDGSTFDATPEHRVLSRNLEYVKLCDLKQDDSIFPFNSFDSNGYRQVSNTGVRMRGGLHRNRRQYRLINEFYRGDIDGRDMRIHHCDFDKLNDSISNLCVMSKEAHQRLHADRMMGEKNPIHAVLAGPNRAKFLERLSKATSGLKNPRAYVDVSNDEIRKHALSFTRMLGRRFSKREWFDYSKQNKLPLLGKFRQCELGTTYELSCWAANECGLRFIAVDTRVQRTYINALNDGYDATIIDGRVIVTKKCEICGELMSKCYAQRQHAYCSYACSTKAINKDAKACSTYDGGNNHKVVSVEFLGYEDVYNIAVDDNHNYHVVTSHDDELFVKSSGICVKNCSELPLSMLDSCRLMVLNLLSFVIDPFTPDARFDFELFGRVAMKAQRLMDDMIELEAECFDRIIEKIRNDPEPDFIKNVELSMWVEARETLLKGRRTGLGPTAVGDTLAALGLTYGSDDAIVVVEEIYRSLALASYRASAQLAKERGSFSVHDYELEKDHVFMRQLFDEDPELEEMVKRHGRRNIACNTTAPCGTVSLMTQTTSGIEPVYLLEYTRRTKISDTDSDQRVDFVDDMGDRWREFDVTHHGFRQWMDVTGLSDVGESPYHKATSADIDWGAKVKLQAAAQRWVDHSISNTTNIPEDTPVEVTRSIYEAAWKAGCKGVTVYRAGARTGVLVGKEELFKQRCAPKRPEELPCKIHHAQIKGEQWTILVGLLDGKPFEIFGGLAKYVEIPKKYTEGVIIKRKRKSTNSIYDFKFGFNGDTMKIKNIVEAFDNPNNSVVTRMISLSLRHGAKIQYVVEQLQKDRDADMFSFSKCIARVLKSYITDGEQTTAVKVCPTCSSTEFAYQEGCPICLGCGWQVCA